MPSIAWSRNTTPTSTASVLFAIRPLVRRARNRDQDRFQREALLGGPKRAATARISRHGRERISYPLGVPVFRVYAGTFAFGVALAGLSGVLLAPIYSVFPTMGKDFILMAFSVVIIGGMGSIKGAVVAGLLLAQIQAISSLYMSPVWTDPLLFGIMVLFLMVRPQGLYGKLGNG